MTRPLEWMSKTGNSWSERWREIDAALSGLSPQLLSTVLAASPGAPFRALDIGCGAGTTTIAVARSRPDASIIACDLSPDLVKVIEKRASGIEGIRVVLGDVEKLAPREGPFKLFFSRHGVMFFVDPVRAFRSLSDAAAEEAAIVFSCFRDWAANPWASEMACAAADRVLPPPGREPSGFAFSDPDYVRQILVSSGWRHAECRPAEFSYVAGEGAEAVAKALSLLSEIGPASAVLSELAGKEREAALGRMRKVVESHADGASVAIPAAAWIWSARAGAA